MFRPRSLLPALALTAGLTGAALAGATLTASSSAAAAGPVEDDAPLAMTIGAMTPATVPEQGPIRITGVITNRDDEAWERINIYPFVSTAPMTSAELAVAKDVPAAAYVGERITDPEPYATIERLEPGQSSTYTVRLPRSELTITEEGVYWFGVHALGESASQPRDLIADGRARTFLPLVDQAGDADEAVDLALMMPLRHQVKHEADGRVADVSEWTATLSSGGHLSEFVDLGAATSARLTWLVDPAVVDAATRLSVGNPARSLAATLPEPDADEPDALPDPDAEDSTPPSTSTSPSPLPQSEQRDLDPETAAAATAAADWLARLRRALAGDEVLVTPYGDLDLAAAARQDTADYEAARERSLRSLSAWGITPKAAAVPPSGLMSASALNMLDGADVVVVGDKILDNPRLSTAPVVSLGGREVVVASSDAASGGPGPDNPSAPVAVRQRILAEAAVRRGDGGSLTVVVPTRVAADYRSLDDITGTWIRATTVSALAAGTPSVRAESDQISYPEGQERREIPRENFLAANDLLVAGATLQNLLTRNDQIAGLVAAESTSATSYHSRDYPSSARIRVADATGWVDEQLSSIRVEAPDRVTLSSASGQFGAIVANSLDEPVTVNLKAIAEQPMVIDNAGTLELPPNSRRTVLLTATTDRQGVHNVTLRLTDLDGVSVGDEVRFPVRAAQVGQVIWVIIGIGGALLFGAIAVRLVRRVRRRGDPAESTTDQEQPTG